jgi:hypothetical protein
MMADRVLGSCCVIVAPVRNGISAAEPGRIETAIAEEIEVYGLPVPEM